MPTYEYRCDACGHTFERFQRMNDEPVRECPECGEESAERMISPGAGLIFRGSGFYATDYRKDAGGAGEDGGEGASGEDAGASGEGSAGGSGSAAGDEGATTGGSGHPDD